MVAPYGYSKIRRTAVRRILRGERNGVFIINFAKNLFKHAVSFDVVGAIINRPFDNVI